MSVTVSVTRAALQAAAGQPGSAAGQPGFIDGDPSLKDVALYIWQALYIWK